MSGPTDRAPVEDVVLPDDRAVVTAMREAGATQKEWSALTHESGPYDITRLNVFTRRFVDLICQLAARKAGT